jgi:hypothetical protein
LAIPSCRATGNIVKAFRSACVAPIISLRRNMGEQIVDGADFHIEPDPEPLLNVIADILNNRASGSLAQR